MDTFCYVSFLYLLCCLVCFLNYSYLFLMALRLHAVKGLNKWLSCGTFYFCFDTFCTRSGVVHYFMDSCSLFSSLFCIFYRDMHSSL